jgi:hypothetical protein
MENQQRMDDQKARLTKAAKLASAPSIMCIRSPSTAKTVVQISTPEEGRAAVRRLKLEGADFIKPYDQLRADVYAAAAEEGRRQRAFLTAAFAILKFDDPCCAQAVRAVAESGAFVAPDLNNGERCFDAGSERLLRDPRLLYLPASIQASF